MLDEEEKTGETKVSTEEPLESTPSEEELYSTKEGQLSERGSDRLRSPEFPIAIDARTEEALKDLFEKLAEGLARSQKTLESLATIEKSGEIILHAEATVSAADVAKWAEQLAAGTHDQTQQEYYTLAEERRRLQELPSTYDLPRDQVAERAEVLGIEFSGVRSRLPGLGKRHMEDVRGQVYDREQSMLMATYDRQDKLKTPAGEASSLELAAEPELPINSERRNGSDVYLLEVDKPEQIVELVDSINQLRAQNRQRIESELFGDGSRVSRIVELIANLPKEERQDAAQKAIDQLLQRLHVEPDSTSSSVDRYLPLTIDKFHDQLVADLGYGSLRQPSLVSDTLPIMYFDDRDEAELQDVADKYTETTGKVLWGRDYGEEDKVGDPISAKAFIEKQRSAFINHMLLGETPFIHTTPVLERIVQAGALKSKQMVEAEQRYNNMTGVVGGAHSNLIHFCPDTFNPYWAQFSNDKSTYQSRRYPGQMEYQGGVAVPLSEVVKQSSISMEGTERFGTDFVTIELHEELDGVPPELIAKIRQEEARLSDPDVVTPSNGMDRSLDWAFASSENPATAAGYEYPLEDSYIFTNDMERTRQDLLGSGKSEEWIAEHVLELPTDLQNFGRPGYETELTRLTQNPNIA